MTDHTTLNCAPSTQAGRTTFFFPGPELGPVDTEDAALLSIGEDTDTSEVGIPATAEDPDDCEDDEMFAVET